MTNEEKIKSILDSVGDMKEDRGMIFKYHFCDHKALQKELKRMEGIKDRYYYLTGVKDPFISVMCDYNEGVFDFQIDIDYNKGIITLKLKRLREIPIAFIGKSWEDKLTGGEGMVISDREMERNEWGRIVRNIYWYLEREIDAHQHRIDILTRVVEK